MAKKRNRKRRSSGRRRHHARENPKSETGHYVIAGLVGFAVGAVGFWAFTNTQTFETYYENQLVNSTLNSLNQSNPTSSTPTSST